jgi:uncharacterized protein
MSMTSFSGFAWDGSNRQKYQKHGVLISEIEYVLVHAETVVMPDPKNAQAKARFLAIGRTEQGRCTFVVYGSQSERATLLRSISARYMHGWEIRKYEQEIARVQKRPGG